MGSIILETLLQRLVSENQELRKPIVSFEVLFYVRICCPLVDRKVLVRNLESTEPYSPQVGAIKGK